MKIKCLSCNAFWDNLSSKLMYIAGTFAYLLGGIVLINYVARWFHLKGLQTYTLFKSYCIIGLIVFGGFLFIKKKIKVTGLVITVLGSLIMVAQIYLVSKKIIPAW